MKITLHLIAALVCISSLHAKSDHIFTSLGTFALDPSTSLKLEKVENAQSIVATIKGTALASDGKTTFTPSTGKQTACSLNVPFAFYWDSSTRILWWAAPSEIGFLDFHNSNSTKTQTLPFEQGIKKFSVPNELKEEIKTRNIENRKTEQAAPSNGDKPSN